MFLSKLVLNPRDRQTRFDIARPYEMHRTLWRAFPGEEAGGAGRVLFRVDTDRLGGSPIVLVQSAAEPNWTALPSGYLLRAAESKLFDLHVSSGQKLRFRLRANPTKRVAAKNQRLGSVMEGKRVGLVTEADQIAWLLRKAEDGGFRVPGGWVHEKHKLTSESVQLPNFRVDVVPEGRDKNDKTGHRDGAFVAVRFDGVLEVTDPRLFSQTVCAGVGSAKGFGFGLLSVAPA